MNSKTVFSLRNEAKYLTGILKLNKLTEALNIAQSSFSTEPDDIWIQKALAYTLIDLCKYHVSAQNINQAQNYYSILLSIDFEEEDNVIESQKVYLLAKIDINYSEVQKAEEFSKNAKHQDALNIFKKLIAENRLSELHHEAYGWVIYRYIKDKASDLNSIQVRILLKEYMLLQNERPSMLHSVMLNFALHYSKDHSDFNLYNFFKLWNPVNLRNEDKEKQTFEGKEIPSLLSRIFREFIDKNLAIDIDYFIESIDMQSWHGGYTSKQKVLDLLREPFFWKIFNAHKENNQTELWDIFNIYNQTFSKYGKSKWHSEILSIAERYMNETDEWRFLDFFNNWNIENLMDEDWKEIKKDGKVYKPNAIKCLKKAFDIIKTQNKVFKETWLLPVYAKGIELYPDDDWLVRDYALLLIKSKALESAITIYRKLVLELGDKSYIWNEFSSCFNEETDLKIGMLSKAIRLEMNEDFIGDIRLELVKELLKNGLVENCIVELKMYKKHRDLRGWRLSELFAELSKQTNDFTTKLNNNNELYDKYISIAEHYAYSEIKWTDVVLVDKWKNDEGKERITFSNGQAIEFAVGSKKFSILEFAKIGSVFKFKLHRQEIKKENEINFTRTRKFILPEYKYIPLIIEKSDLGDWSILGDICATIDYINSEKNIIHAISTENKEVFFHQGGNNLQIGEFITAKYFTKKVKDEIRIELRNIEKIEKVIGLSKFPKIVAVIDGVNEEKNLFHYVGSRAVQGIIRFSETDIVPEEGKFLEIIFISKKDKKQNKTIYKAIEIKETEAINPDLIKFINGSLELKYKRENGTFGYSDLSKDETNNTLPDFGFVEDYYVPRNVLMNNHITENCSVKATAIFAGEKWKIVKLIKI